MIVLYIVAAWIVVAAVLGLGLGRIIGRMGA
jgi:hypothetical protein